MRRLFFFFQISVLASVLLCQFMMADYKQAVAYYNQGRYEKAIQELKPDMDRNPEWEFGHRLLGLSYLSLNNNALAEVELSRAVELKSTAYSAYYGLAQAYYNQKKFEDCISALNKGEQFIANETEQVKEKSYRLRGSAYYQVGKYAEAAINLTNAIRLNPSNWADFSMLGIAYFKLDRLDEAIQSLEKSLSMKPGEQTTSEVLSKIFLKKGVSALSDKHYKAAVQALLKAKDHDPKNGYVYFNLAEAYLFEKKYPDAEAALIQAVDLMPENREIYERLGLIYEKQKKWERALDAYQKAEGISPSKATKESITRVKENMKQ